MTTKHKTLIFATIFLVLTSAINAIATPKIQQFEEFLADNLAKDKLGSSFILKKLSDTEIIDGSGDIVARHLALARTYNPAEAERILNLLAQQRFNGDKIIHLSETFMENSNIVALKNNNVLVSKIAEEVEEVIKTAI